MLNLNRANLSEEPLNVALNDAIERAHAATAELPRPYLGASIVGEDCARKIQFDWWCKPLLPARVRRIFDRGHFFEARTREQLKTAKFKFAPDSELAFSAFNGDYLRVRRQIRIQKYPYLWTKVPNRIVLGFKVKHSDSNQIFSGKQLTTN